MVARSGGSEWLLTDLCSKRSWSKKKKNTHTHRHTHSFINSSAEWQHVITCPQTRTEPKQTQENTLATTRQVATTRWPAPLKTFHVTPMLCWSFKAFGHVWRNGALPGKGHRSKHPNIDKDEQNVNT